MYFYFLRVSKKDLIIIRYLGRSEVYLFDFQMQNTLKENPFFSDFYDF